MAISRTFGSIISSKNTRILLLVAVAAGTIAGGCRRVVVVPTPQMETAKSSWIRVRLSGGQTSSTVAVPSGSVLADERPFGGVPIPGGYQPFSVAVAPGGLSINGIIVQGRRITLTPGNPYIFELNGRRYRGNVTLVLSADGSTFEMINEVPLEAYLAGVIGSEMPNYWEPEALKAQAIAARTYCLHTKQRYGVNRGWDVSPTEAHQVYSGMSAETPQIWDVVKATWGKVLVCTDASGMETVFPTYYSSTCGGHTEDGSNVFGESWKCLKGVPCPYCRDVAPPEKYQWPAASYDLAEASRLIFEKYPSLRSLGEISAIAPSKQSQYDAGKWARILYVKLTGTNGQTGTLKGQDLRLTLDPSGRKIMSTACYIQIEGRTLRFVGGRGWGHGVGMCQCGAQGMARKGFSTEQILSHYYPGAVMRQMY